MSGLQMKYFILKPGGSGAFASASRSAMREFASAIRPHNSELAADVERWANEETDKAETAAIAALNAIEGKPLR